MQARDDKRVGLTNDAPVATIESRGRNVDERVSVRSTESKFPEGKPYDAAVSSATNERRRDTMIHSLSTKDCCLKRSLPY